MPNRHADERDGLQPDDDARADLHSLRQAVYATEKRTVVLIVGNRERVTKQVLELLAAAADYGAVKDNLESRIILLRHRLRRSAPTCRSYRQGADGLR